MLMNDGEYFHGEPFMFSEALEQKQSREKEKAYVISNKKVIENVIIRLQTRVEYYSSVLSIDAIDETPESFMIQWKANQMTVGNLQQEIDYWKNQLVSAKS